MSRPLIACRNDVGHPNLMGHPPDVINGAEGNANQFIDGVNPNSETSSEAAERALGKVPNNPSPEVVKAVEELLKPKDEPKKTEHLERKQQQEPPRGLSTTPRKSPGSPVEMTIV